MQRQSFLYHPLCAPTCVHSRKTILPVGMHFPFSDETESCLYKESSAMLEENKQRRCMHAQPEDDKSPLKPSNALHYSLEAG